MSKSNSNESSQLSVEVKSQQSLALTLTPSQQTIQRAVEQKNALVVVKELGIVTSKDIAVYQRSITSKNAYDSSVDQISVLRRDDYDSLFATTMALIDYCDKQYNVTRGLSDEQCEQIADDIISDFWYLRLNEVVFACKKGVSGGYGKGYSKVDKETIFEWINSYNNNDRENTIYSQRVGKAQQEKEQIEKEAELVREAYKNEQDFIAAHGVSRVEYYSKEKNKGFKDEIKAKNEATAAAFGVVASKQSREKDFNQAYEHLTANGFEYSEVVLEKRASPSHPKSKFTPKPTTEVEGRFYREDFPMIRIDISYRMFLGFSEMKEYNWEELKKIINEELSLNF